METTMTTTLNMATLAANGRWLMWNTVSTGAYTFTQPTGVSWVQGLWVGGGGGGGGGNTSEDKGGGGGGGGAVCHRMIPCTANITGSLGAGGALGAKGNPGAAGGNGSDTTVTAGTSFNFTVEGGEQGLGASSTDDGFGGRGGWGDLYSGTGSDGGPVTWADGIDGLGSFAGAIGGGGGAGQGSGDNNTGGSCSGFNGAAGWHGGNSYGAGGANHTAGSIPGGGGGGGHYNTDGAAGARGYVEFWYML